MSRYDPSRVYAEQQWLIRGLWLGGGKINGLFGVPKAGKSRLLGWGLVSLLSGRAFMPELPLGTTRPDRILYIHAEEDEESVSKRLQQYARVLGAPDDDWQDRLIFMPGMNMALDEPVNRVALSKVLESVRPGLLVIDPYVRIHGANEQDAGEMARIHNDFRRWVQELGLDIVLLHHTGKLGKDVEWEHDPSRWARGTSEIAAMVDASVYVHRTRAGIVKLYRIGRFAPLPPLSILDQGDERAWEKFMERRASEKELANDVDLEIA